MTTYLSIPPTIGQRKVLLPLRRISPTTSSASVFAIGPLVKKETVMTNVLCLVASRSTSWSITPTSLIEWLLNNLGNLIPDIEFVEISLHI